VTRTRGLIMAATLLLALAACGDKKPTPLDPTEQARRNAIETADADCIDQEKKLEKLIVLEASGDKTKNGVAMPVGTSGDTGVVYLHQVGANLCQMLPIATILANKGIRGITVENNIYGPELGAAAVAWLRAQGVKRVFVLGASMGGTHAWAAAELATPPVDGVISLSAPEYYTDANATDAARKLDVPSFIVAAEYDEPFASAAKSLYAATPSKHKNLLLLSGSSHGVGLIDTSLQEQIEAFVADPNTFAVPS
jgi:pimeloyl-ACP methyl ester carboxylesterase/predicted small lipoprotein YifL